jgi:threonine dehydratase
VQTPLERAPEALSAFAGRSELWLKREDVHELGVFKWRSTLPVVRRLGSDAVVTSSTGNHGAAVAWACKQPATTSASRSSRPPPRPSPGRETFHLTGLSSSS